MDDRLFLNNDVSKIVNITPRQVLSWTDKGLIVPFREASGAGTKRGYNYVNLLEFYLCDILFLKGVGIQKIKNLLNHLRASRLMEQWAQNFKEYYIKTHEQYKEHFQSVIDEEKDSDKRKELKKIYDKAFCKIALPDKNIGILIIEDENVHIIPTDMYYAINLTIVKEMFVRSIGVEIIDLGKIKSILDKRTQ